MKNRGFTLIELLVVVLIIGILAAIALPKYQLAVGKSKYNTIKNMAKAIAEAEEVYYLANGHYTNNFSDLDVSKPDNITCYLWNGEGEIKAVACRTDINNVQMRYYQYFQNDPPASAATNRPYTKGGRACLVYSSDVSDIPNRICQQDTGNEGILNNSSGNYTYPY